MEWIIGALVVLWIIGKMGSGKNSAGQSKKSKPGKAGRQIELSVKAVDRTGQQSSPKGKK